MTTAQLSAETGVPVRTIRQLAATLGGTRTGRNGGYVFPQTAAGHLRRLVQEKTAPPAPRGKHSPDWRVVRIRLPKKRPFNP